MFTDLKRIIDQISRDKGIDRRLLVEAIEEAVKTAATKKLGPGCDVEVEYNEELGEIEIYEFRTVVEEITDRDEEILIEDARHLDPDVQLGDDLGIKMGNLADLGRIAAQSAKQVIIQRMKMAEREVVYDMFKDRTGEVVNGIVQRFERGNMIINLGRTEAVLPRNEQIPRRSFKQGDRIRAYLKDVNPEARDQQLVLSRSCSEFLDKLFVMEVPEISEGIVKIMGAAREPGFRAKIAVSSTESDVDPVGACVGMKGSRVQNVVQELQGERIDIVPWSPDPAKYACNALKPVEATMVVVDEDNHSMLVVVPDDQLSLAIGRQGQNVRLAAQLLAWRIDVKSENRYANLENPGYKSLIALDSIDENLADKLFAKGIQSLAILAVAELETLCAIKAIDESRAGELIDLAALKLAENPELANLNNEENADEVKEDIADSLSKGIEDGAVEDAESKQPDADEEGHAEIAAEAGAASEDVENSATEDAVSEQPEDDEGEDDVEVAADVETSVPDNRENEEETL